MNVLLVGNGGRENALAWKLAQSPSVTKVLCPGGNPGIARFADVSAKTPGSHVEWAAFAKQHGAGLVVVGPEVPLSEGLGDALRAAGFPVFGPNQDGARLEFSKKFAKEVMTAAGVPTAQAESFTDAAKAKEFARSLGLPVVIKADGLAAGKGVVVAQTTAEAEAAIDENLQDHRFGEASASILIEEFMAGEEASVFALCDGTNAIPLVAAQDHKRLLDGDEGPNTGGMGAYAPAPVVTEEISSAVYAQIIMPTLAELRRRGIDYRGVLYVGLMISPERGPRVVEFNCRFGDPETQIVLPLLDDDFAQIALACAEGRLGDRTIPTSPQHAVTVVLASGGYPGDYRKHLPISGLEQWEGNKRGIVFHAGTLAKDGAVVTNGGRVLNCTAWDTTLEGALATAYEMAESISFDGKIYRRDIGARAIARKS